MLVKEKRAGKLPRHCERQYVSVCAGHLVSGAIPKKDAVSGHSSAREGSCREAPDTSSSPLVAVRKGRAQGVHGPSSSAHLTDLLSKSWLASLRAGSTAELRKGPWERHAALCTCFGCVGFLQHPSSTVEIPPQRPRPHGTSPQASLMRRLEVSLLSAAG